MDRPAERRRSRALAAVGVLLALAGTAGLLAWQFRGGPGPGGGGRADDDDPRLTFATPYRNVRPGVRYVGDAACAGCHSRQTRKYHQHPMGRSLAPAGRAPAAQRYDRAAHNPFEKFGFHYSVERRGGRLFHRELFRDPKGRPVSEVEAEVAYAVGSGTRGYSYLIARGDDPSAAEIPAGGKAGQGDVFLFQSPVSWFSQKKIWDLSPGFDEATHFERPILAQCLFCHADRADPVEHTLNRYRGPLTDLAAIGCERCHGPGELHVQRRRRGEEAPDPDDTIVNPGRLEPALRESVCQQCHLEGERRVLRRGRQAFDFRPGLPLRLFWSVFVRTPDLAPDQPAVGQVEQMYDSRCFRASGRKLGCISCHDPHEQPPADRKESYYRARCLTCHKNTDCGLAPDDRAAKNGDACTACHMPRARSSDIAHTAVTDHRILKRPDGAGKPARKPRPLRPGENPLVYFHPDDGPSSGGAAGVGDREVSRDMGLALVELAREKGAAARPLADIALPLLEGAVHRAPDDVDALEARGYALWLQGRGKEALDAFEAALARAPRREQTLADAGLLAGSMKKHDRALGYWRRAIEVNPWAGIYRFQLAQLLARQEDWQGALAECRFILRRINPASLETRLLLVRCLLRAGQLDRARDELATLQTLRPREAGGLRDWFERQKNSPPAGPDRPKVQP